MGSPLSPVLAELFMERLEEIAFESSDNHWTPRLFKRLPTHSDRYLHFSSHHPVSVKGGIVTGMVDRAIPICDPEFLNPELHYIATTLEKNGYPKPSSPPP
ncbi:hypothetical protein TTRE_0000965501 [Trichuris trichiura]|uniref:Helix-turn-helix domain-containing protein n=1 Tax=Trichuris trichiura TaxID=36087 RepID=A0A077ZNC7_TRITR|nr:hypothetical protein TTRE_0000965501 [Trichuris trichiura]